jgi:hypothetical protein
MANRGWMTSLPIWVRVSAITILVLIGMVISSILLGGSRIGDHGPGRQTPSGDTPHSSVTEPGGPCGHTLPDGVRDH